MPKVSVLMPIYKTKEEYLRKTIESILSQTFEDFEFLILDDCPNDDRESIVMSYHDTRIKYFKNEKNLGISLTRNKLIKMSKGEYLAVCDHDDISLPERFEKEVKYLDEHSDIGVVSSYINVMRPLCNTLSKCPIEDHDIKLRLLEKCVIIHPCSMIRKSVLIDNNIYYEEEFSPAEDHMLWCRLLNVTNFHNIPEVLLKYRWHRTNVSKVYKDKIRDAKWRVINITRTNNQELYKEYKLQKTCITRIKLFSIIPLFRIVKRNYSIKIYLFEKIPIFKIETRDKLEVL